MPTSSVDCTSTDTSVLLSIKKLRTYCDPFKICPWGDNFSITIKEVGEKIKGGSILNSFNSSNWGKKEHLERIAYFVLNPDPTPIDVDFGIPSLGFVPDWIVEDGNHRLAAAIFRKEKSIRAYCSGEVKIIESLRINRNY